MSADWHDEWCDANGCRCKKCPCSCDWTDDDSLEADELRRRVSELPKAEVTTVPPGATNLTFDYTTGKVYPTPQTWGTGRPS